MTAPARQTQADLTRAIRALRTAGVPAERVGVCYYPDGRIVVQAVPEGAAATGQARGWDDV
jgi:hypothetical protein